MVSPEPSHHERALVWGRNIWSDLGGPRVGSVQPYLSDIVRLYWILVGTNCEKDRSRDVIRSNLISSETNDAQSYP